MRTILIYDKSPTSLLRNWELKCKEQPFKAITATYKRDQKTKFKFKISYKLNNLYSTQNFIAAIWPVY